MREAIRLLHTADWHWGLISWRDSPRSVDRNPEIEAALEDIYNYALKGKPNCILIAGDVFNHYLAPSESDAKKVLSFIIELSKIAPVVMVLGNHDWRGLSTYHLFSSRLGIYIFSSLSSPNEGPFEEIDGLRIFCFPYFPLRNLLKSYSTTELQDRARSYLAEYRSGLKRFAKTDRWNVLLGHLAVDGVSYQNEHTFSSEFFVPKDFLGSDIFDYVALGHIHSQMEVLGTSAISYYCGSLVRVGFGEEFNEVGALWVELKEGSKPRVEPIRVRSKRLKTIRASDVGRLKELLESHNDDSYIRVILELSNREILPSTYYINKIFSLDNRVVKVVLKREEEKAREYPKFDASKDLVEMYESYLRFCGMDNSKLVEKFKFYFKRVEEMEDEAP